MAWPVVIVTSGGIPVTTASNGFGLPYEEATNGFGISVTFVASGGLPVVLGGAGTTPPTLVNLVLTMDPAWTSADATPDFVLDGDLAVADELTYQTQPTGGDWSGATSTNHTVTAPEDVANEVDFALSALANGVYDARVLSSRAATPYGISNTVSFTIAAVSASSRIASAGNRRIASAGNYRINAA